MSIELDFQKWEFPDDTDGLAAANLDFDEGVVGGGGFNLKQTLGVAGVTVLSFSDKNGWVTTSDGESDRAIDPKLLLENLPTVLSPEEILIEREEDKALQDSGAEIDGYVASHSEPSNLPISYEDRIDFTSRDLRKFKFELFLHQDLLAALKKQLAQNRRIDNPEELSIAIKKVEKEITNLRKIMEEKEAEISFLKKAIRNRANSALAN